VQDEPLLHGDGVRLISVVLPSEFAVDVGVGSSFVAFIFSRVLRELKNIVVVSRWYFVVTGWGDSMQYAEGSVGM
jgi:hypothetical protein